MQGQSIANKTPQVSDKKSNLRKSLIKNTLEGSDTALMLKINQKQSIKEAVKKKIDEKYNSGTDLNVFASLVTKKDKYSVREGVSDRKKSGASSRSPAGNSRKPARMNLDQL